MGSPRRSYRSTRRHRRLSLPLLAGLTLLATPADAFAIRVRHDTPVSAFNALAAQPHLGAVGSLRAGNMACTAALVGPDLVLTAAHCVVHEDGTPVDERSISFTIERSDGSRRTYRARYVDVHPDWDPANNRFTDVAIVTLEVPVVGVTPLPVTVADPHERLATLVGYGTQGTGYDRAEGSSLPGAGRKIAAHNIIDRVRQDCCHNGNIVINVDFDHPDHSRSSSFGDGRAIPLEGSASFGDSGSPLLARFGDRDAIVGVASYIRGVGSPGPTGYGEISGYQWTGSGSVSSWLHMMGVDLIDNPFRDGVPVVNGDEPGGGTDPADAASVLGAILNGAGNGDLNNDGSVDLRDASTLLIDLGYTPDRYQKRRDYNRALKRFYRETVSPSLTGWSARERKQIWRIIKQASRSLKR